MSDPKPFVSTASAALRLYERWSETALSMAVGDHTPSLLDLQTACRETGCALPELDSYARARAHPKPGFLLCGGDASLATEIAALFGHTSEFVEIPESLTVWRVDRGGARIFVCRGAQEQAVMRDQIPEVIAALPPDDDMIFIEESADAPATWRFLWLPHPQRFHAPDPSASETEVLLIQRAAMILEDTPNPLRKTLEDLGQKLWLTTRDQVSTQAERERLLLEILTLEEERADELELRAQASWSWLVTRMLEHITAKRREYTQLLQQQEMRLSSTQHLLGQYRKNWSGGVRSLVETHLQARTTGPAFAAFYDAGKPGPQTSSFLGALGLPSLWGKLDDYVVDRMVDFMGGLAGLAAKLDLLQITLGDAKARWHVKSLTSKLEAVLNEKHIFPSDGGRRGGLVGNLTGRSQAVLDERKAQILKAVRVSTQCIESEFATWTGALTGTIEEAINSQLAAALAQKGFADVASLRTALQGLDKLEKLIQGKSDSKHRPEAVALEWLHHITTRRWIPLYQTEGLRAKG